MSQTEDLLSTDSELPPLQNGTLRVYSNRGCPFAQRARIVLEYKNIPFEEINISLKNKPKWYYDKNPLGKVPCLEQDGKLVYESAVVCEYLDAVYPGPELVHSDPYKRSQDRMLFERFSQVISAYYATSRTKGEEKEPREKLYQGLTVLEHELVARGKFFGGEEPMLNDFLFWPQMERMKRNEYVQIDPLTCPKLTAWFDHMVAIPAVKKTASSP